MYTNLVVLFCCFCSSVTLDEGCKVSNGNLGTCQLFSNCTYAKNLLQNKEYPVVCGFSGLEAIVCCRQETTIEEHKPLLLANLQGTAVIMKKPLSDRKCLEYYPKPKYPILVTGGKPSLVKEFPHMAIIGYGDKNNISWQCGGSLISHNFILTAAHCLYSDDLGSSNWVRLGDLDLSTDADDAEPQDFTIIRKILHPDFKHPIRYHDIAILELDRPVALSVYVSPACLSTENIIKEGTKMTASGWGITEYFGEKSNFLMKIDLEYFEHGKCRKSFASVSKRFLPNGIAEGQLCAGGVIGQDTCQGDSGGPLQVKNPERTFTVSVHTLIGITSFGKACGLSASPGVYTKVSDYIPWIESVVWPNEK